MHRKLLSTLILVLATVTPVLAAPGDPDPTFGIGGVADVPTTGTSGTA